LQHYPFESAGVHGVEEVAIIGNKQGHQCTLWPTEKPVDRKDPSAGRAFGSPRPLVVPPVRSESAGFRRNRRVRRRRTDDELAQIKLLHTEMTDVDTKSGLLLSDDLPKLNKLINDAGVPQITFSKDVVAHRRGGVSRRSTIDGWRR
jgi:hypothetical protein